ncbi:hypothetical protein P152DRAFT_458620 [Eremomyces bilateralis CBS 781.70]|uniref:Uncharacterized protein n=1 Tax=Eremomyces bilateralis CBS 781.70 TaxID=1392243 RepID=A0A6G1G344_9PEZI|nr:uncharacterized protein P152DRAFT_458620 [Eremomyces bilateralis CBS 781.70]KAF1812229.1 hypothetical protein P152DRAFT_458620 [Eremomyces bilateralis CBS 781.70]
MPTHENIDPLQPTSSHPPKQAYDHSPPSPSPNPKSQAQPSVPPRLTIWKQSLNQPHDNASPTPHALENIDRKDACLLSPPLQKHTPKVLPKPPMSPPPPETPPSTPFLAPRPNSPSQPHCSPPPQSASV